MTPVSLPPLTYLSFDSLSEGVGASQVVPYVVALGKRGVRVTLHSYEKRLPQEGTLITLRDAGVEWVVHRFVSHGARGGLMRIVRAAKAIRGAELLHARSDLAAASALLSGARNWLWDMRSFWADERIDQGSLVAGSLEDRVLRTVERRAVRSAGAIVTLADAALPVLVDRHGGVVVHKTRTITTCVDLDRFKAEPLPPLDSIKVLLSGTLNRRYDTEAMIHFVQHLNRRMPTELIVLCPTETRPPDFVRLAAASLGSAAPSDMPGHVSRSHLGIAILKAGTTPANRASMPTKLGEFLASGRPVVVSSDIGDMADLLGSFDAGVSVASTDNDALEQAADEIVRLLHDDQTPIRCRTLAESHFDLERGVDVLVDTYRSILNRP